MPIEREVMDELNHDEAYFDDAKDRRRTFDTKLLQEPLTLLPSRPPLALAGSASVKDAMQAMKRRHRGCVLITEDGTIRSPLTGIFTERDVLLKIIDSGRNPATVPTRRRDDVGSRVAADRCKARLGSQYDVGWRLSTPSGHRPSTLARLHPLGARYRRVPCRVFSGRNSQPSS